MVHLPPGVEVLDTRGFVADDRKLGYLDDDGDWLSGSLPQVVRAV
jgi:hypothetical protein